MELGPLGLEVFAQAKICVPFFCPGVFDIPFVPNFDLEIHDTQDISSWLFGPFNCVTAADDTGLETLFEVTLGIVGVALDARLTGEKTICDGVLTVDGMHYDSEGECHPVDVGCSGYNATAFYSVDANVTVGIELCPRIFLCVGFLCWDLKFCIAEFDIYSMPINIPFNSSGVNIQADSCGNGNCEPSCAENCDNCADCACLPGEVCVGGICKPTGACCLLPGPNCVVSTEDDCTADDGKYQGDGTTCGGLSCRECQDASHCDDGDPCTLDECVDGECVHTPIVGCCDTDVDCDDGDPCTNDKCVDGVCEYSDTCGNGICEPSCGETCSNCADCACPPGEVCVGGICMPTGACCFLPGPTCEEMLPEADCLAMGGKYQGDSTTCGSPPCRDCQKNGHCDDGDPCTIDTCVDGVCVHTPVDCDDGDPCTNDKCVDGVCEYSDICCPGDINGDGAVDGADLGLLLAAWGRCPKPCPPCLADLNGDCVVDGADLGIILGVWGFCPK